jgi:hypothetical protein
MIRRPLTCPTCGDTWKRVVNENFTRLGPPLHECRACWTPFPTGAKEWANMGWSARAGYFLQNLVIVAPLAVLLVLALVFCYFFGNVAPEDAEDYLLFGCMVLLGIYILLCLWSALMVTLSLRRTKRTSAAPAEPPDSPESHYPQGRPNPRPEDPADHRGWPL